MILLTSSKIVVQIGYVLSLRQETFYKQKCIVQRRAILCISSLLYDWIDFFGLSIIIFCVQVE